MARVVIIGAGPGLGLGIARRFADEGLDVTLVARRRATLDLLVQELEPSSIDVQAVEGDAGRPDELQQLLTDLVATSGVPDVVVYNAAHVARDHPRELDPAAQLRAWSVNVQGALVAASVVLPVMADRGTGTFLITGGMPEPVTDWFSLSVGKAGLRAAATMLADYYPREGVHVATVTVDGPIAAGTDFDPDLIAEEYWRLHQQDREHWETKVLFDGRAGS